MSTNDDHATASSDDAAQASSAHAELRALVEQAVRAPSSHNTQPWLFRITDRTLELRADRTRALPVNDPEDRELTISCGAALANVRIAAAARGRVLEVQLLPREDDPDLLARAILIGRHAPREQGAEALFAAIGARRTHRAAFTSERVPEGMIGELARAAASEGAVLHVLRHEAERARAAELVAEGDRELWANPSWRRELAAWLHPRRQGDGLAIAGIAVQAAKLVVRAFDRGELAGEKDRELALDAPLLAVIATPGDAPADWLAAGLALEHVLLTARVAGLQASYLNQAIQVQALRAQLRGLIGGADMPQLLLRVGVATESAEATPRRPIDAVLD